MKKRRSRFFIIALVSAALMFGLTGQTMAEDAVKLGVAGAHSGDLASYGIPSVRAAELVVEHRLEDWEAAELAQDLAYNFAKSAYKL